MADSCEHCKRRWGELSEEVMCKLLDEVDQPHVRKWLARIADMLHAFSRQRALRNMPAPFLPGSGASPLGIEGLRCALHDWLGSRLTETASAGQWRRRLENLSSNGLRAEELQHSGILQKLDGIAATGKLNGRGVLALLAYADLRISVVPVIGKSISQLQWEKVEPESERKGVAPKTSRHAVAKLHLRDPVLGYQVDVVRWDDLLGKASCFVASSGRGQLLTSGNTAFCRSVDEARQLAAADAARLLPKVSSMGRWSKWRLNGGEEYREWLVTLPYFPQTFLSAHFNHRNIVIHIRCDIRELDGGSRGLVLQEVQSDWASEARSNSEENLPAAPWAQEWPALALKLILLHAARRGFAALAWTSGETQVQRYGGQGNRGLLELYDRMLPREATRLLKPFGKECGKIDVFQPVNFFIEPDDVGYKVRHQNGRLLGRANTREEAEMLLPDGAHEMLQEMHGIVLDAELRTAILARGFFAWGQGIRE